VLARVIIAALVAADVVMFLTMIWGWKNGH